MLVAERDIFLRFHRLVFCWLDNWCDLTLEQVTEAENDLYPYVVVMLHLLAFDIRQVSLHYRTA